jgi:hypothetical protein
MNERPVLDTLRAGRGHYVNVLKIGCFDCVRDEILSNFTPH